MGEVELEGEGVGRSGVDSVEEAGKMGVWRSGEKERVVEEEGEREREGRGRGGVVRCRSKTHGRGGGGARKRKGMAR